jgi:hypothetical protein
MAFTLSRTRADDLARAQDPETAATDLMSLSLHRDAAVRAAVGSRRDCPLATLLNLALEDDPRVVEAVAANPMLPERILEMLAEHKRSGVRAIARKRLGYVTT